MKAILLLFLLIASCATQIQVENSFLVIDEGTIKKDGQRYDYQLLRLQGAEVPSYATYFPRGEEVILIARPYIGIDWTGEEIDRTRKHVASTEDIMTDSMIYLYNNFSVLNVYARFYAGGDIENDVEDIVAGLEFLDEKHERIGITGSSWGGFEAIYGAASSDVKPDVGTAFYPPTDFTAWTEWSITTGEEFFVPYQERVRSADVTYDHQYLLEHLETEFLIFHAYEDTLVPFNQSFELAANNDYVSGYWYHKIKGNLSHGTDNDTVPLEYSIQTAYLMSKLTDRPIVVLSDSTMNQTSEILKAPNVHLFDVHTKKIIPSIYNKTFN